MPDSVLFLHEIGGGRGGAERYLQLLGATLLQRGIRADLVVFGRDPAAGREATDHLRDSFVTAEHLPHACRPGPVRQAVQRCRPDVLHWNFNDPFAFSGGLWPAIPWGAPSVITDHLPMLRAGFHREVPRALANRALGAVIVVGPAAGAAAQEHWPSLRRLSVIPNGVPQRTRIARTDIASTRRLCLVVLGRLEPQKDPLFALEVTRALVESGVDVGLRFVGDGTMHGALEGRARELGLVGRVSFAGHCNDPGPELDAADVLLAPSHFEGAPLVPREALAAALPVVLSDIAAHRELLEGSSVLRTAPLGDVHAWERAVLGVSQNLAAASREAVAAADRFSLDTMVERTLDCYRAAVDRQRRR